MAKYERHIIAFIDFLGFREALRNEDRAEKILQMLMSLAAFRGDFYAESSPAEGGGKRSSIRPAISAFSDNIVISYPMEAIAEHGIDAWTAGIFLQQLIGFIAWNAFEARLLIRGGIAIGNLYHSGGLVFGPALVDAYDAERTMAHYPRVVLDDSFYEADGFEKWKNNFPQQEDGFRTLEYLTQFILRMPPGGGKFNGLVKTWTAQVRETVAEEIRALTGTDNVRGLANWHWFNANLERTLGTLNPALREMNTPTV